MAFVDCYWIITIVVINVVFFFISVIVFLACYVSFNNTFNMFYVEHNTG